MLKQHPEYESGYVERAKLYEKKKNYYAALKDISQATELNPCRKYFFQKGIYFKKLKYWKEAKESFEKALAILEESIITDHEIISELTEAELNLFQYKSAFKRFKKFGQNNRPK